MATPICRCWPPCEFFRMTRVRVRSKIPPLLDHETRAEAEWKLFGNIASRSSPGPAPTPRCIAAFGVPPPIHAAVFDDDVAAVRWLGFMPAALPCQSSVPSVVDSRVSPLLYSPWKSELLLFYLLSGVPGLRRTGAVSRIGVPASTDCGWSPSGARPVPRRNSAPPTARFCKNGRPVRCTMRITG